nr:MAG TPA: acriflavine resistance protein B [Caudoviricetes sp.]
MLSLFYFFAVRPTNRLKLVGHALSATLRA